MILFSVNRQLPRVGLIFPHATAYETLLVHLFENSSLFYQRLGPSLSSMSTSPPTFTVIHSNLIITSSHFRLPHDINISIVRLHYQIIIPFSLTLTVYLFHVLLQSLPFHRINLVNPYFEGFMQDLSFSDLILNRPSSLEVTYPSIVVLNCVTKQVGA